ncbi:MAG: ABC transporter permease subunit [Thiolinea sp.]
MQRQFDWGRFLLIAIPFIWLLVFFLLPFAIVVKISLSDTANALPPYVPTLNLSEGLSGITSFISQLDFESFAWLLDDKIYILSYLNSLKIAFISTLLTLLIGYPMAYGLAKAPQRWRTVLLMLVILPFWTSFLIRVYAWIGILKPEGLLNMGLMSLGLIDEPLAIINTPTAVYIGIVYSYLPFLVLPLYATLEKLDNTLIEAALDLGCSPIQAFWKVTFPLSLPGVVAGCFLVFIPAMGEFVIPDLLGGSDTIMIGKTLWSEFFGNRDWPIASAVAVVLLLSLVVPIVIFQRIQERQQEDNA